MKDDIKKLFKEDVKERKHPDLCNRLDELKKHDKERVKKLKIILEKNKEELDPQTLFYAGFIFHHQGTQAATTKARSLSKQGVKLCLNKNSKACKQVRWLYAGSTDRLLRLQGKPQKYGTQYKRNKKDGSYTLGKVDSKTTDEERKALNVPTLKEAHKLAKKIR